MSRPRFSQAIHDKLMAAIEQLTNDGHDVSFAAVARTAGHARGLISKEDCAYAAVRDRIMAIRSDSRSARSDSARKPVKPSPANSQDMELLAEIRSLRLVVDELSSALAASIVTANATAAAGTQSGQAADLQKRLAARRQRAASEMLT